MWGSSNWQTEMYSDIEKQLFARVTQKSKTPKQCAVWSKLEAAPSTLLERLQEKPHQLQPPNPNTPRPLKGLPPQSSTRAILTFSSV